MSLKELLQRKITMTVIQRQSMIIVALLSTLLLITVWPRFLNDAMSVAWYVYLLLIIIFMIPFFKRS